MTNGTKHSVGCKMAFGRKDPSCTRCQELLKGAAPRDGWQANYYSRKATRDAEFVAALKAHDCKRANCSHVCTFGDW